MSEISLIPMNESHLQKTFEWLSDPFLRQQLDTLKTPTVDGNKVHWQQNFQKTDRSDFAILQGKNHVGNCGLKDICQHRKKSELWIYIPRKNDIGIGRRALTLLLMYAFVELALYRVWLRVLKTNPRALAFYEKFGFIREGTFRADTWHRGQPIDSHLLSLLAPEFKK